MRALDEIAPLHGPPSEFPPGSGFYHATITFEVEILERPKSMGPLSTDDEDSLTLADPHSEKAS